MVRGCVGVVVAGIGAVLVAGALVGRGGEIRLATDAPKALAPGESAKLFQVPEGFRIELVAAEPLLADPVAMCFDARGRVFVCEIHGYNLEGYLDVVELNKTGELDRAVRRIPANEKALREAAKQQYGTVKVLEDTDGDGRLDRARVWADRLPACYGVVAARDGVIVLCAPDIVFLADRDGDGTAEVRETLFTGFGCYDMWSRVNNPRWGIDNWIYGVAAIQSGGTIRGPKLAGEVRIGDTCFRFKPDGSAFEPCSGSTSGYGQAINDWGDRFLVTNQQHALLVAPLPHRYLKRNPYYAAPNPTVNISTYGHPARVYPTSRPDPWRLARSKDPEWVKFYGVAEATANGFFTAASGQTIYRARQFPEGYWDNHFSVDNAQNLVHRCLLEAAGNGYQVRRAPGEERREFLTSTEQWFRPVNLTVGPDGALYIVDMYRDIIEDYSAIPRYLQQLYVESIIAGADRGRIWRAVANGAAEPRKVDLAEATTDALVRELANENAWWRHTAQRLLVERGDAAAVEPLVDLVRNGKMPQARLHALYTLDGLGKLKPELIRVALADAHFAVRMHALQLAEPWLDRDPTLLERALSLVDDEHPRVRLQLAFTLGETRDPRAAEALARLAARDGGDRWVQAAVLSSVSESADRLLAAILRRSDRSDQSGNLLAPLASVAGARHRDEEIARVLAAVADAPGEAADADQLACMKGLVEGLQRGKSERLESSAGQLALGKLLVHGSAEVRQLALRATDLLDVQQGPQMQAAFAAAKKTVRDESRGIEERTAAIGLLANAPFDDLADLAEDLLDPRQPPQVQLATVRALAQAEEAEVGEVLLDRFETYSPAVREAVIEAMFQRTNRLPALLDAIEEERVGAASLDAFRRIQLLENSDAEIRGRAKSLLGSTATKGREEVLARYQAALTGARDAQRGKAVYEKQCAKCHRLADEGFQVGPDLSAANNRSDEMILADVLDPNRQITAGYRNYTVITQDGKIFTGVLAAETATSITLRKEEAADTVILRRDIDELAATELSMMPEELEKEVKPRELADLIAYLREALGPVAPGAVTLFDEERSFAEVLTDGDGTAQIKSEDAYAGNVCLAITPPQRWNLRVPGWEYPIVKDPGPGQYRYLRFAWRSRGGRGVMIELAGGGQWPPADKPLRRYHAGANETGWASVEVSPEVPAGWVVVTRDLWKDFGPFTLTGIAPTAIGAEADFDRIELLRSLDPVSQPLAPAE